MDGLLIFSENDDLALGLVPQAIELAKGLNKELGAVVLGPDAAKRAEKYFNCGVSKAYVNENEVFAGFDSKLFAEALAKAVEAGNADMVICASTKKAKIMAPRLSVMMDAGCITNALDIKIEDGKPVISRYGLGGATIISERLEATKNIVVLPPESADDVAGAGSSGEVVRIDLEIGNPEVTSVEKENRKREAVDIEKAEILVSVGEGFGKKEDLAMAQELAEIVGGEVGCTRGICSHKQWLSEDRLVGLSGKRCKPKLVFSIGVSGQNQYIAGITGARVTVAINNDENAPIFKLSDYGIVADLNTALPKLIEKLK